MVTTPLSLESSWHPWPGEKTPWASRQAARGTLLETIVTMPGSGSRERTTATPKLSLCRGFHGSSSLCSTMRIYMECGQRAVNRYDTIDRNKCENKPNHDGQDLVRWSRCSDGQ
jgi:hypothetical protein